MIKICIVLPFRNEEKILRKCLDTLLGFQIPFGVTTAILAINGGSQDGSREVAEKVAKEFTQVVILDNPKRFQGCAVNQAVQTRPADFYLWLGAHTLFPQDYLVRCLETHKRTGAQIVGGICETLPGGESYGAKVVQAITTHKFGVGDSSFRVGGSEGVTDTVPYALFAKEVFDRCGFLDERLVRAQDYEFNRRAAGMGMKIWINPEIRCGYRNQPSFWGFLKKQILLEAPYNSYLWYLAPYAFKWRHAITGIFAVGVLGGLVVSWFSPIMGGLFLSLMILYGVLAVGAALQQARRYGEWRHLFVLPTCFFLFHFGHGLGVLQGLIRLATGTAPVQGDREPWPGAGFRRIPRAWFQKNHPGHRSSK